MPTASAVAKLARSFSEEALRTLLALMRDPELHGNVPIKAAEAIMNRGLGLPWGAPRSHGELFKLGMDVGQTTVAKYMAKRRRPPSPDHTARYRGVALGRKEKCHVHQT